MELHDYLTILRRRWLSLAVLTLLGVSAAAAYSYMLTPIYTARAQVFVSVRGVDSVGEMVQGTTFTVRAVKTYTQLVTSPAVLQPVIDELGLPTTAAALAGQVSAQQPLDTVLINVTANHPSPQLSADIANATASSLARVVEALETPAIGGEPPVAISTVRHAEVPYAPSSPNVQLNLGLGLLIGLALGVGFAVLREVLNTKIRGVGDVEPLTDAPVLGGISYQADAQQHPLIIQESPNSARAEAFRRLRTNLQFLHVDGGSRALVFTSALAGEGKSTTVLNLAITLANAGQRVVVVDADLRRPSSHKYLGIEGAVGLTTLLIGRAEIDDVIQPWGNGNLDVIASGVVPPNPAELLGSEKMSTLLASLCERYDVVLIDTAPLLPVTDAAILARMVGGAIVTVGANTVHKAQVSAALETLAAAGAPVLGLVVNRVSVKNDDKYSYQYTYYGYSQEPIKAAAPPKLSNRLALKGFGGRHNAAAPAATADNQPIPADQPIDLNQLLPAAPSLKEPALAGGASKRGQGYFK